MQIQSYHEAIMPEIPDAPTPESIAAAKAANQLEREEAIAAAKACGWDLRFDTDGRPYCLEADDAH